MTAIAFSRQTDAASRASFLENLVFEVFLFLESKAKVSIIQVPNHSPSVGSSSINTTATEVQTPHKKRIRDASNLLAFIPSRCPILANFSVVEFFLQLTVSKFRKRKIKSMFTLVQIAFAPTRNLYRTGPLFTHKSGDSGAISVTERSCAAPH